jgi:hypothetical protein
MLRLLPPPQRTLSTSPSAGVIRADIGVEKGSSGFPTSDFRHGGWIGSLGRGDGLRHLL